MNELLIALGIELDEFFDERFDEIFNQMSEGNMGKCSYDENMILHAVGNRLRELRQEYGYTFKEMAKEACIIYHDIKDLIDAIDRK